MTATKSPSVLYRYQKNARGFTDLVQFGRLWFSNPSGFNDPFDLLPDFSESKVKASYEARSEAYKRDTNFRGSLEQYLSATQAQSDKMVRELCNAEQIQFSKHFAKDFRVVCLTECSRNILMWSHYANNHTGICFGIRPDRLRLAPERALRWKVDYQDDRIPIECPDKRAFALRKSKVWEYEREWRIVMATKDLEKRLLSNDYKGGDTTAKSDVGECFLKVSLDAVESIRFGALVDGKKRAEILETLRVNEKLQVATIQVHLSANRFELEEEAIGN